MSATMLTCQTNHPHPYGRTACADPARSEVFDGAAWTPVCAAWADEFGIQGARLRQLDPMRTLGELLASTMPPESAFDAATMPACGDDVCGWCHDGPRSDSRTYPELCDRCAAEAHDEDRADAMRDER